MIVSSCGLIGRSRLVPDGRLLQEPALVLALDLAVLGEHRGSVSFTSCGELRVALAEHDAVGIVGEKLADDLVVAPAPCSARSGRRAARRRWRRRRPCRLRPARTTRHGRATTRSFMLELELRRELAHRLLVGGARRHRPPSCPARSRNDLIGEPFFTISLVPETKIVGEKATRFWRSRLFVVEPHSRSTWPRGHRVDARSRRSPAAT